MTAQARTGTSGDGALSINQDHRTRELWRKASEQLPDNRRGEEGRVETHKTELQDSVDRWCNCGLKQRLRQIRMLMFDPGKLARKNVERRSRLALAQLHVTKHRGSPWAVFAGRCWPFLFSRHWSWSQQAPRVPRWKPTWIHIQVVQPCDRHHLNLPNGY